jgi:hypothetical protein
VESQTITVRGRGLFFGEKKNSFPGFIGDSETSGRSFLCFEMLMMMKSRAFADTHFNLQREANENKFAIQRYRKQSRDTTKIKTIIVTYKQQ